MDAQSKVWKCFVEVSCGDLYSSNCSFVQISAPKKRIAMCHSWSQTEHQSMINDMIPCTAIYSKVYDNGTLYALVLSRQSSHKNLSNKLDEVEKALHTIGTVEVTGFRPMRSDSFNGRIKTFNRGEHSKSPEYNAMFETKFPGGGRELRVHSDVKAWYPGAEEYSVFDVVKKRKLMDASESVDQVSAPAALLAFEDFELSVLPALNSICANEEDFKRQEMLDLEKLLAQGILPLHTGGVYFAWSSCLGCMKIGFTRREDPHIRLKELSRYVTSPFTLAAWLPSPTPMRLETTTHKHFCNKRISTPGAGTEFFSITEADAEAYVSGLFI